MMVNMIYLFTIFGDIVPYNILWRTGANRNTLITFSHDVVISGQPLSKGTYALYTTPNKDAWMVYFYNKTENWGTPAQWNEEQISLAVRAKVQDVSHKDSYQLFFQQINSWSLIYQK